MEENKDQIQSGDLVQLKSGGPVMTVEEVLEGGEVNCVWQDKVGNIKQVRINIAALEKVEKKTGDGKSTFLRLAGEMGKCHTEVTGKGVQEDLPKKNCATKVEGYIIGDSTIINKKGWVPQNGELVWGYALNNWIRGVYIGKLSETEHIVLSDGCERNLNGLFITESIAGGQ